MLAGGLKDRGSILFLFDLLVCLALSSKYCCKTDEGLSKLMNALINGRYERRKNIRRPGKYFRDVLKAQWRNARLMQSFSKGHLHGRKNRSPPGSFSFP